MTTFSNAFQISRINKLSTELAILNARIEGHEKGYHSSSYQEYILARDNMIKKRDRLMDQIAEIAMGAE